MSPPPPSRVNVPIRIRVDPVALAERPDEIEDALTAAAGRALDSSCRVLLADAGPAADVRVDPPRITWSGDGLRDVDESTRAAMAALVAGVLAGAVTALGLNQLTRAARGTPKPIRGSTRRLGKTRITTAPGGEHAFWEILRRTALSRDLPELQRQDAIDALVDLRDWPEAVAILRDALSDPEQWRVTRWQTLGALRKVAGSHDDVWALMLLAVGAPQEWIAENTFAYRFRQGGGVYMVGFLERRLQGDDPVLREKAASVTLYLLDLQYQEEGRRLARNLTRLRAMASRNHIWTSGALGVGSLRQLVRSQLELLVDLNTALLDELARGPSGDPFDDADRQALERLAEALDGRRQTVDAADLSDLERLDTRLSQGVEAAVAVRQQMEALHDNVRALRRYLGEASGESDEIGALFELRHGYVSTFANLLDLRGDFVAAMHRADLAYAHLDDAVAALKWRRIRSRFHGAVQVLIQGKELQPGAGPVDDEFFFRLRDSVDEAQAWLQSELASEVVGRLRGVTVRVRGLGPPSLARVVELETAVNVFALYVGMFTLYALALRVHNDMLRYDIGSGSFREEQGARLTGIRTEIAGYARKRQFAQFSKRADTLRAQIEDVTRAIQRRARLDVAIHLLITAVAALLTVGAAAIARIALLGETLAVLRTADAAGTVVLLVEAGTFTVAQLAGEAIAFGRPAELGRAAEGFLQNVVTFGVFRIVGDLVRPLSGGRALLGFVLPHAVNLTIVTGVATLVTRLQTGAWPHELGMFLLESLGSYIIIAGVSAAGEAAVRRAAAPHIQARIQTLTDQLDTELAGLYRRYQRAVESGTISKAGFEAMRQERLGLNARARELASYLHNERLITDEQAAAVVERLDADVIFVRAARFTAPPGRLTGRPDALVVRALPLPADVPGLTRLGATEVYRYDPARPPAHVEPLLADYEAMLFVVRRYPGGLVRVTDHTGRTLFVLQPGPPVAGLLPPPSVAPRPPTPDRFRFLQKATGDLSESQLEAIATRLREVEPGVLSTLQAEFPEDTGTAALTLLVEARNELTTRWNRDGVRGLARMLELERGITLANVRRLFRELSSGELNTLFRRFHEIADMPGANLLVEEETPPRASAQLIAAYDTIRRTRLQLPHHMSRQAVRGLRRWLVEHRNVVDELSGTGPESRLAVLEAASPRVDPTRRPVTRIEAVLRRHAEDIRPGLNLLHGSPAEVAKAVEALGGRHGGGFSSPSVRTELERRIRSYRAEVAKLQGGAGVDTRNLEGGRGEVEAVIVTLESGVVVDTVGNLVVFTVNPASQPLPGGLTVQNAPPLVRVQLDVGGHRASGRLILVETTTARLYLPKFLAGLDPESGSASGGTLDWRSFDPDSAVDRKWMQIIKLRQLASFLHDLDAAFRGSDTGPVALDLPELVVQVSGADAPSRRAVARLGVRLEILREP
jgi:hypothetical protein